VAALGAPTPTLVIMRFRILRRITRCPWTIGRIVSAAVALFNHRHGFVDPKVSYSATDTY
jgi:hypothetical protein